ncbi:MAG: septum formation initiator family protein [Verrucomicrobiota bacterium]
MAVGFVVVATAVPQQRRVVELEAQLAQANVREQDMLAERESYEIEHRALREDPAFLEIHARDRLNVYREGERVLRFHKAE